MSHFNSPDSNFSFPPTHFKPHKILKNLKSETFHIPRRKWGIDIVDSIYCIPSKPICFCSACFAMHTCIQHCNARKHKRDDSFKCVIKFRR